MFGPKVEQQERSYFTRRSGCQDTDVFLEETSWDDVVRLKHKTLRQMDAVTNTSATPPSSLSAVLPAFCHMADEK